jgi:protein-disulfide isomerase
MIRRREFVSLGALALTGCLGGGSGADGNGGATPFENHPATAGIEDVPSLGGDSDRRIVAFEDPSCPTCARHSRNAFPELEEDTNNDELVYHIRNVPVVHPDWSRPACNALFATHDRDEEVYWTLLSSYYEGQRETNADNVYERTRGYLEDTPVDADAVVEDAREERFDGEVNANVSAARDAEVPGTPTFYLFDSDGFVTKASGARGYNTFSTALGL